MKERPILFSGEMVCAILDERKTKTRRIIKHRHEFEIREDKNGVPWPYFPSYVYAEPEPMKLVCPYGQPGDRLWVRENFYGVLWTDDGVHEYEKIFYDATMTEADRYDLRGDRLRPSIHMPRWASRINLEVVSVRVERVQDITEEDAIEEGTSYFIAAGKTKRAVMSMKSAFAGLWDSINLKRGYGWDVNPLVWVVEFKRLP